MNEVVLGLAWSSLLSVCEKLCAAPQSQSLECDTAFAPYNRSNQAQESAA